MTILKQTLNNTSGKNIELPTKYIKNILIKDINNYIYII